MAETLTIEVSGGGEGWECKTEGTWEKKRRGRFRRKRGDSLRVEDKISENWGSEC